MAGPPCQAPRVAGDLPGTLVAAKVEPLPGIANPLAAFLDDFGDEGQQFDLVARQRQQAGLALRQIEHAFDLFAQPLDRSENVADIVPALLAQLAAEAALQP